MQPKLSYKGDQNIGNLKFFLQSLLAVVILAQVWANVLSHSSWLLVGEIEAIEWTKTMDGESEGEKEEKKKEKKDELIPDEDEVNHAALIHAMATHTFQNIQAQYHQDLHTPPPEHLA